MLKAIGNYITSMGWLFLPESFVALDKQQHGMAAIIITIFTFFPSIGIINLGALYAALLSVVINAVIAWGYEYAQKYEWFGIKGDFDPKDAIIMMAVNLILVQLFVIRVVYIGTATWF